MAVWGQVFVVADWCPKSAAEQLAEHLRGELLRRRWSGMMPGVHFLAAEMGGHCKTADSALRLLENEGLLIPQGAVFSVDTAISR